MGRVIIGIGSNIEPDKNIQKAKKALAEKCTILAESNFIRTNPIGNSDQADFINGTVLLETELTVEQLTKDLKDIESSLGRGGDHEQYGPRTIDLDIVVWNRSITDKDFYQRSYLKESVLELIPDLEY